MITSTTPTFKGLRMDSRDRRSVHQQLQSHGAPVNGRTTEVFSSRLIFAVVAVPAAREGQTYRIVCRARRDKLPHANTLSAGIRDEVRCAASAEGMKEPRKLMGTELRSGLVALPQVLQPLLTRTCVLQMRQYRTYLFGEMAQSSSLGLPEFPRSNHFALFGRFNE